MATIKPAKPITPAAAEKPAGPQAGTRRTTAISSTDPASTRTTRGWISNDNATTRRTRAGMNSNASTRTTR
jgi:hypothetical protein